MSVEAGAPAEAPPASAPAPESTPRTEAPEPSDKPEPSHEPSDAPAKGGDTSPPTSVPEVAPPNDAPEPSDTSEPSPARDTPAASPGENEGTAPDLAERSGPPETGAEPEPEGSKTPENDDQPDGSAATAADRPDGEEDTAAAPAPEDPEHAADTPEAGDPTGESGDREIPEVEGSGPAPSDTSDSTDDPGTASMSDQPLEPAVQVAPPGETSAPEPEAENDGQRGGSPTTDDATAAPDKAAPPDKIAASGDSEPEPEDTDDQASGEPTPDGSTPSGTAPVEAGADRARAGVDPEAGAEPALADAATNDQEPQPENKTTEDAAPDEAPSTAEDIQARPTHAEGHEDDAPEPEDGDWPDHAPQEDPIPVAGASETDMGDGAAVPADRVGPVDRPDSIAAANTPADAAGTSDVDRPRESPCPTERLSSRPSDIGDHLRPDNDRVADRFGDKAKERRDKGDSKGAGDARQMQGAVEGGGNEHLGDLDPAAQHRLLKPTERLPNTLRPGAIRNDTPPGLRNAGFDKYAIAPTRDGGSQVALSPADSARHRGARPESMPLHAAVYRRGDPEGSRPVFSKPIPTVADANPIAGHRDAPAKEWAADQARGQLPSAGRRLGRLASDHAADLGEVAGSLGGPGGAMAGKAAGNQLTPVDKRPLVDRTVGLPFTPKELGPDGPYRLAVEKPQYGDWGLDHPDRVRDIRQAGVDQLHHDGQLSDLAHRAARQGIADCFNGYGSDREGRNLLLGEDGTAQYLAHRGNR